METGEENKKKKKVILSFCSKAYLICASCFPGQDLIMIIPVWDTSKRSQKLVNKTCSGKSCSNKVSVRCKSRVNAFHPVKCCA